MANRTAIAIISLIMVGLMASSAKAQQCEWVRDNVCREESPILSNADLCPDRGSNGLCCCVEEPWYGDTSQRIVIIGAIVLVLGTITVLSFLMKHNEEPS